MKDYNEEYFFLDTAGYPNLPNLDASEDLDDLPLFHEKPVSEDEMPFVLTLSDPIPKKPKMVDYHSYGTRHVVNEKLKQVLERFNLKNTQFVPTEIIGKKDELYDGYYIVHIYNYIKCLNRQKSKFTTLTGGYISTFDKLVLDNDVLDKIPLNDRLAFAIGEQSIYTVFHISVVEELLKAQPEGMTVYRLSKWNSSAPIIEEISHFLLDK